MLLNSDKKYIATLYLGQATDTGDKEGNIVLEKPILNLSAQQINLAFKKFTGELEQIPPMYSALKHKGKPLYEYARQGINIERPARKITIFSLELLSIEKNIIKFEVHCSKGTYIRVLGEDIASFLGTVGHLTQLHRTQIGSILAEQMHTVEELSSADTKYLQPLDLPLQHLQAIHLNEQDTNLIKHGGKLAIDKPKTDIVRFYDMNNVFFGVGEWQYEKQLLKPKRLFNL